MLRKKCLYNGTNVKASCDVATYRLKYAVINTYFKTHIDGNLYKIKFERLEGRRMQQVDRLILLRTGTSD